VDTTNNEVQPQLIPFPRIGSEEKGFLVPYEGLPFPIEHVYCIGPVPEGETRGHHAKKKNSQVLVAIGGVAHIHLESPSGKKFDFRLDGNHTGLLIPAGYWRTAELAKGCFLIGLHSMKYNELDYIRDYEEFKRLNNR